MVWYFKYFGWVRISGVVIYMCIVNGVWCFKFGVGVGGKIEVFC